MKFSLFVVCLVMMILTSLVSACQKSGDCYPGCEYDKECPEDKACLNHRCRDICDGPCGRNAECKAVDHRPECRCPKGATGSPYVECYPKDLTLKSLITER